MIAPDDPRRLAFEVLCRVEDRGAHADATLGNRLQSHHLGGADLALATRLVYGVLAWQGRLDWCLGRFCTTPPERLDPWLRVVLRLGLYQLLILDRVPDYAAVDTSVELARRYRRGAACGLVNATLRRAAVEGRTLPLPDPAVDPIAALAVRWSHPPWLVARWREELGPDAADALLAANQEAAPTVLRVNTLRTDRAAVLHALRANAAPTRYSPVGVRLLSPLAEMHTLPADSTTLQGEASQLVSYLVAPRPGERVLDACSVPGGKATHLAALMQNHGEVVAVDVDGPRLAALAKRAANLGITIIRPHRADARLLASDAHLPGAPEPFHRILVDAPCSGLGTLRGHPELRWRIRANDVAMLAQRQRELLDGVAPLCAPDGVLVYATCTLMHQENDATLHAFLAAHRDFNLEDPRPDLPDDIHPLLDSHGVLRTSPDRHGLDGFFAARVRRRRG